MPTENRSSNTREHLDTLWRQIQDSALRSEDPPHVRFAAALLAQPAEQSHGEPVALVDSPRCGASWPQFDSVCGKTKDGKSTWQCGECARKEAASLRVEMDKYFGLYKEADTHAMHWQRQERVKARWAKQVEGERDTLRAQLAERDALLRRVVACDDAREYNLDSCIGDIRAALSAGTEPSAPVERDERAAFEADWARRKNADGCRQRSNAFYRIQPNDRYRWNDVQDGWDAWQARAALERKP